MSYAQQRIATHDGRHSFGPGPVSGANRRLTNGNILQYQNIPQSQKSSKIEKSGWRGDTSQRGRKSQTTVSKSDT